MSFTAALSMVVKPISSISSKPHVPSLFTATKTLVPPPILSISSSKHFKIPNLCRSYSSLKAEKLRFGLVIPCVTQEEGAAAAAVTVEEEEQQDEVEEEVVVASEESEVVEEEEVSGEEEEEEETYSEPPEEAKLFVGNLHYDVDSEALAQLFNQAGVVEIAEVIYNRETDRSRGFGFITMSSVEEAAQAVEKFNGYQLNGRSLTVNIAAPRGAPRPERTPRTFAPAFKIYVGNLPWEMDDARLEQVFSEHGKVVDARVIFDRETQRSRGFGFVTMSNETEMNDAVAALDGQTLEGRAIRVNVAEERPRRSSF